MAKKALKTGEGTEHIPESMRKYLGIQAINTGQSRGGAFGPQNILPCGSAHHRKHSDKVCIRHFTCQSLNISEWMWVGHNTMDLLVFYTINTCTITYYINNNRATGCKIEYPFQYVKKVYFENHGNNATGGIVFELSHPPYFFIDSMGPGGFTKVGDFTVDQQVSQCLVYHLGGDPKALSSQLGKLVLLEAFVNRH